MAIRITLEVNDYFAYGEEIHRWAHTVLRDALAEYQSNRGPTSRDYVEKRYAGNPSLNTEAKIQEIDAKKFVAADLNSASFSIDESL